MFIFSKSSSTHIRGSILENINFYLQKVYQLFVFIVVMEERKIRIDNLEEIENKLKIAGACLIEELEIVDTYYKQPEGSVLKITENDHGNFLVKLKEIDGKFEFIKNEKVEKLKPLKDALKEKYGRDIIVDKQMWFYRWKEYIASINLIDEIGNFLVVRGHSVPEDIFADLGIQNPEVITVPFSELVKDSIDL